MMHILYITLGIPNFRPVLIKTKLIFSLEEPVKEEKKIEPNCVKIENGIAPSHGLVSGFYLS